MVLKNNQKIQKNYQIMKIVGIGVDIVKIKELVHP